jgi:YD repeat-containing protein
MTWATVSGNRSGRQYSDDPVAGAARAADGYHHGRWRHHPFYYDEHHGLARIVDPLGQSTLLKRDAFGQVVEEVDAAGNTRRQEYNEAGQIIRETDCSGVSPVIAFTRSVGCSR